ncbi:DNA topoisomerase, partial [Operophtera brumata]
MSILVRNGFNLQRKVFNVYSYYYPILTIFRCKSETMKYLNVAEKNDAAKNIALQLSRGTSRHVCGQKSQMVMTSVSGHLLALEFVGTYKHWQSCNPLALFDAPKTLEREIRSCQGLIIWTDCDREGENIGFEIIQVCTAAKSNLRIFRAKFSEITSVSVNRALQNLEQPDKNTSDAVDVRMELDLRIVNHTMNGLSVDFTWDRVRLFDQDACQVLHDVCLESPLAKGFISYPRTETNEYPKEMNLDLSGNEQRLYEFIVRSFLACCSKDAQGQETTCTIEIATEKFSASGLMITARNYLEVYPYDKWSSKEIHVYQSRSYVALADAIHFVPGLLGMGLVEGYDAMGLSMSKPHLRAGLEADLKAISGNVQGGVLDSDCRGVENRRRARGAINLSTVRANTSQSTANTIPNTHTSWQNTNTSRQNTNNSGQSTNNVTAMPRPAQRPTNPTQFLPSSTVNRIPNTRMPTPRPSGDGDDNNVLCVCNKPAILLTVRKQTANF